MITFPITVVSRKSGCVLSTVKLSPQPLEHASVWPGGAPGPGAAIGRGPRPRGLGAATPPGSQGRPGLGPGSTFILRGPIELARNNRIIVTFPYSSAALLDGLSVEVIALQLAVEELSANAMG